MTASTFDIFRVGIGPSSSHTVGPMVAAARFLDELRSLEGDAPASISCSLHGSLAFTGKGHGTDRAVVLGLAGASPETLNPDDCEAIEAKVRATRGVSPPGLPTCTFDMDRDLVFDYGPALPGHPNGLRFRALDRAGREIASSTFYSIGGGTVIREGEDRPTDSEDGASLPFPFTSATEMLRMGSASGRRIAEMMKANECARRDAASVDRKLDQLWSHMTSCIDRGLRQEGLLPGPLKVPRRAKKLHVDLQNDRGRNDILPHQQSDWLSVYAIAVNEENAAGGRVVTAPTNGASGVIPAVMRYFLEQSPASEPSQSREMLLVAAAIGGIIKRNASISGAEVGCQGEVGSASAMAAAALCSVLGGNNEQIENAAEIALEHHLGMTCDPVGGLVQIPCIERNSFGAVKAATAASLALRGDGVHVISLDQCIATMLQTGRDMSDKYRETSLGGLAVNAVAC